MASAGDIVRGAFEHLNRSAEASEAMINEVQAILESIPEAEVAIALAAVGVDTSDKRKGATIIASARAILKAAGAVIPALAIL